MKEKEIIAMQIEEIKKSAIFRGTYKVYVHHFDGRKISENSFDNYDDAIVFYDKKCLEYHTTRSAHVSFHIDFTLI